MFANYVAAAIALFVSFEVGNLIETHSRLGFVAAVWLWPAIAVFRMETVVDVPAEVVGAMKPWAGTNEYATRKPFRAVISVGSAVVRRGIVVAVGTVRRDSNADHYLSLGFGRSYGKADCSHSS